MIDSEWRRSLRGERVERGEPRGSGGYLESTESTESPESTESTERTEPMLLYAVAALAVQRADGSPGGRWFQRRPSALAAVISREEDVSDILLRLPDSWNIVDGARCVGLHDDVDILGGDPRFNRGFVKANCAIVGHSDGLRFALLMQINAAEAVLLPERLFVRRDAFEGCLNA